MNLPTRTAETEAQYRKRGDRFLRRAQARFPQLDDVEALLADLAARATPTDGQPATAWKGTTCRVYKQAYRSAVSSALDGKADAEERRAAAFAAIEDVLRVLRGRPAEPRTSSRKVKDATETEIATILRYLAKRARGRRNRDTVCMLALYIFFAPRVGCRPVEWSDARVEGSWLIVRNAKATNGRGVFEERSIGLHHFSPLVIEAAAIFARIARLAIVRHPSFEHWRSALAEELARCCMACGVRRLSLYSLRHVALATWAAAGCAPWEIAALAGHASPKTARRWYAGGRHGWAARDGIALADPQRAEDLERAYEKRRRPAAELPADDDFTFDDMPQPAQKAEPAGSDRIGPAAWLAYRATLARRSEELSERLRKDATDRDRATGPEPEADGEPRQRPGPE